MAKTTASKGKVFKGELPKIRKAINAVGKKIEAGQKVAAAEVAKAQKAPPGSPAREKLAENKAALKKANDMLAGLRKTQKIVAKYCCNNDQGCNFFVHIASRR